MNDHPKQPKWKRQPDEDGWWWIKFSTDHNDYMGVVKIVTDSAVTRVMIAGSDYAEWLSEIDESAEWFGPLEPPSCFKDYPE